jgi:hypothetical protein
MPSVADPADILLAGAGRLHHLIDRAVTLFEKAPAEPEGYLIDHLGLLVRKQGPKRE